ncbi:hypothetical protein R52603_02110 [Paraburkholderia saeva]|nr:hypothetical protein R52603_02110 [Paraburkholderia saeva]
MPIDQLVHRRVVVTGGLGALGPPTFAHQRFLLLTVIDAALLFHLQHSHCLRSLYAVASTG